MNIDTLFVYLEMAFQAITAVMGGIILVRARDNRLRLFWGVVTIATSVILLLDNVKWLRVMEYYEEENFYLLQMGRLLKWFLIAHCCSLFPLAALRPGYLDQYRVAYVSIPLIITCSVGLSYHCFVEQYTVLAHLGDVVTYWNNFDVQLRVFTFAVSFLFPVLNSSYMFGIYKKNSVRSSNFGLRFYLSVACLLLLLYLLFSWVPSPIVGMLYGMTTAFFLFCFSVLIIREENPFTNPPTIEVRRKLQEELLLSIKGEKNSADSGDSLAHKSTMPPERILMAEELRVYKLLLQYMDEKKPYLNPDFDEFTVLKELQTKHQIVVSVILYEGFTSFREYVSYYRIEHFKRMARQNPGASIKQLIFDSGFQSRATFYRNFENFESLTPKEFIASLGGTMQDEE